MILTIIVEVDPCERGHPWKDEDAGKTKGTWHLSTLALGMTGAVAALRPLRFIALIDTVTFP